MKVKNMPVRRVIRAARALRRMGLLNPKYVEHPTDVRIRMGAAARKEQYENVARH